MSLMQDHRRQPSPKFRKTVLCGLLGIALSLSATGASAQANDPLLRFSKDPVVIASQARAALPRTQRAYELLSSSHGVEAIAASVEAARAAYRYLRQAQENADVVIRISKYPDPVLVLQKDLMWKVRTHLLKCIDNWGHLNPDNPRKIAECLDNLGQALARLEALLATMP